VRDCSAEATRHESGPQRREWTNWRRSPISLGKTPPFVDGQIAAIALTHALALVTANPKDFKSFKGLTVLNWASGK
jgi:tRNA(fMet)-specific endonuclease VapC